LSGFDDPLFLFAVAGACAAVGIPALFAALLLGNGRGQAARRIARVQDRWRPEAAAATGTLRRDTAESGFGGLDRFVRNWLPRREMLRQRLARTGRNIPLGHYVMVCGIAALLTGFATKLFFDRGALLTLLAACVGGVGLPHFVIGRMIARRANAFITQFADAIDLIVRGLRSGLPIQETIATIAAEVREPVGGEFRRVDAGLKLGQALEDALWAAAARIGLPEFRFFVISLSVQRETGGNLAETLQNLGDLLRRRRQMRLKIKAMSSEAKASAWIIGALPFLMMGFLALTNLDYIMPLFTDRRGNILLGLGLGSLSTGVLVMMKMVRFEI